MDQQNRYTITLDDDPTVSRFIARATGINSLPFAAADMLVRRASSYKPVAVFVDVNLDGSVRGIDVIPELRKAWRDAPILVITSDLKESLIGEALAAGANDFIHKPINTTELVARMHVRIAEMQVRHNAHTFKLGDISFCSMRGSLESETASASLPRIETHLLRVLCENQGMLVGRDELKMRIWGRVKVSENTVDKKVSNLRKALERVSTVVHVKSLYGKGVILEVDQPLRSAA